MEWNHECVSKSKKKCWALGSKFLEAWAILYKFLKQGCCRHLFQSNRVIQNKQRNNCEATEMMARKVHVCMKDWDFHLVTPPKCQKLPSPIPKTAHVKFQATSGSLPTTLWCYYRGQNWVVVIIRCLYLSSLVCVVLSSKFSLEVNVCLILYFHLLKHHTTSSHLSCWDMW
jgi:hypothetical protein